MENENNDEMVLITIPISDDLLPVTSGTYEVISMPEEVASESSDDALLNNLLQEFQMESVFQYLKDSKVTFRSLQYMKKEDIKEAIPPLGLRMEFREKLFAWKKKKFGIDEDTLSMPSKVGEWLKNCKDTSSTPTSSVNTAVYL